MNPFRKLDAKGQDRPSWEESEKAVRDFLGEKPCTDEGSWARPVPVIAGHYREYLMFVRSHALVDRKDVRYESIPESLHGREMGSLVVLVGSYAARPDWPNIKAALEMFRATLDYMDVNGQPLL